MKTLTTRDHVGMSAAVEAGEDFQTNGAMSGVANPRYISTGRMPQEHADRYTRDEETGEVVYVIFSYYTPIAWKMRDGSVRRPRTRYSVTTSKHQTTAGVALGE